MIDISNKQTQFIILPILAISFIGLMYNSILMSIEFQQSFATTEDELEIAWRMGVIMPLLASVMLTCVTGFYVKKKQFLFYITTIMFLALMVYEWHGYAGFFSNMNEQFEANSKVVKIQEKQLEIANNKAESLSNYSNIDQTATQLLIETTKKDLIIAKTNLKNCPSNYYKACKIPAGAEISRLNLIIADSSTKLAGANRYHSALKHQERALASLLGGDEAIEALKTHGVFKMQSRMVRGDVSKSKILQSLFLLFLACLLLLLSLALPSVMLALVIINETVHSPTPPNNPIKTRTLNDFLSNLTSRFNHQSAPQSSTAAQNNSQQPIAQTNVQNDSNVFQFSRPISQYHTDLGTGERTQVSTESAVQNSSRPPESRVLTDSTRGNVNGDTGTTGANSERYTRFKKAVQNGAYFQVYSTISVAKVRGYIAATEENGIGATLATKYIEALKRDGVIDSDKKLIEQGRAA